MDGVFMKKLLLLCAVALSLFGISCLHQKAVLRENIIRLHIVANSDSDYDQSQKLLVRDAVTNYLNPYLQDISSTEEAEKLLLSQLPMIEEIALAAIHGRQKVTVTLTEESFDTRHYDTFSLPAGVYSSLRIRIGEAEGANWWCVVFPTLCLPATTEGFSDVAAGSGFGDSLSGSLTGKKVYKFRFFLLDCLGKIENFFYMS